MIYAYHTNLLLFSSEFTSYIKQNQGLFGTIARWRVVTNNKKDSIVMNQVLLVIFGHADLPISDSA